MELIRTFGYLGAVLTLLILLLAAPVMIITCGAFIAAQKFFGGSVLPVPSRSEVWFLVILGTASLLTWLWLFINGSFSGGRIL